MYFAIVVLVFFIALIALIVAYKLEVVIESEADIVLGVCCSIIYSAGWIIFIPLTVVAGVAYLVATGIVKRIKRKEKKE